MYTGGHHEAFPFDNLLYHGFNSQLVSAPPSPNPCASTMTGSIVSNYEYVCSPDYDAWSSAMEFSLCTSAAGDPVAGTASNAVAGTCPGASGTCPTTPTACSATSGRFNSELIFMQGAFEIPIFSQLLTFAYLSNWDSLPRFIPTIMNNAGPGLPNYITCLA